MTQYSQRTGFKNYMAVISKQLTLRGFNFAMFLPEVFESNWELI